MPGNNGVAAGASCGDMAAGLGACVGTMPMAGKGTLGSTMTSSGTTGSGATGGSAGKATVASTYGEDFAIDMIWDTASKQAVQQRLHISTTKLLTLLGRNLV